LNFFLTCHTSYPQAVPYGGGGFGGHGGFGQGHYGQQGHHGQQGHGGYVPTNK
jgi:hypothetical protein